MDNWTFEGLKSDLNSLDPTVKEKALIIAKELIRQGNYAEKEAITEAIKRAEEWFYDREG